MPMSVKKLHIATNIDELKEQAAIKDALQRFSNNQINNAVKSAKKLFDSAKESMAKSIEDQELTFTYLFRAMELYTLSMKSEEVKKDRTYFILMHRKDMKTCMELLETYSKELQKRYSDRTVQSDVNDLDQYQLNSSITVKKMKGTEAKLNGHITNGITNSLKISKEKDFNIDDFNIEMLPNTQVPVDSMDYYGGKKYIECEDLKELMISPTEVLILDIRPTKDFEQSRIDRVHNINIPATSIRADLSANKLGLLITNPKEKASWKARDQYKQVVLMDWHSETKDVIPNSPLSILKNILLKWDPDSIYKNPPLILNGGFEKWLDMYPMFTSNPNIQCPPKPVPNQFIHLSEHNIEYPMSDLEDIIHPRPKVIPKPPVAEVHKPVQIPTVDRTTKPDLAVNTEKQDNGMEAPKSVDKKKLTSDMEEEMTVGDKNQETSTGNSTPEPSVITQQPVRPVTPLKPVENTYPTTPKQTPDKGEGDGEFTLEKLKFSSTHRSGGLKRSSSSPTINKIVDDDMNKATPTFDRSIKPKPMNNFDTYSPRGVNMDLYLTHGKTGKGLTGLKNLGNLCYMNSIMQCISNTVELTQELTRFNVEEVSTRRQIASEVSMLLRVLWQGTTKVYTCRDLKSRVGSLRQTFSTSEQQDSHEFLTILMDWLHEDLNEPSPVRSLSGADESTGEKAWGEFKKKNNSLILNLFYGQLKSTVTCTHCQKQSVLFEPFSNLSIPLPANQDTTFEKDRTYTLQDCLKLYLSGEPISGWVCPSCKAPRDATKKLDITRLPPILIIHLKRFMNDMVGVGWCRKRMNKVDFPINEFSMKQFTHPDSELRTDTYNLYAVSNHYGSMESGHYTAYCKNHLLNKWYKFDDQDVNEISPSDVRSSAAYILFYESTHLERSRQNIY